MVQIGGTVEKNGSSDSDAREKVVIVLVLAVIQVCNVHLVEQSVDIHVGGSS